MNSESTIARHEGATIKFLHAVEMMTAKCLFFYVVLQGASTTNNG
jgi:hypothetical protein